MQQPQPINKEDVKQLIHEWGRLHDDHAAPASFKPLIAEEGFEIRFGDLVLKGCSGLIKYRAIKQPFFDEAHIYNSIDVTVSDSQAEAKSVVQWEGSVRENSAPRSQRIKAIIHHTWLIKRSSGTGKLVILHHIIDSLKYLPGFEPSTSVKPVPEAPAAKAS
jgi:hypothetical protein